MKSFKLCLVVMFTLSSLFFAVSGSTTPVYAQLSSNEVLCTNGAIVQYAPGENPSQVCPAGTARVTDAQLLSSCSYKTIPPELVATGETIETLRAACIAAGPPAPPPEVIVPCTTDRSGSFFGLSPWNKYLNGETVAGECNVKISALNDIWKIGLAVLESLLKIGAYIAVAMVIFGGFMYSTSQGEPDKTKQALGTIRLALIGLIVTIAATVIVSFIAGRFPSTIVSFIAGRF